MDVDLACCASLPARMAALPGAPRYQVRRSFLRRRFSVIQSRRTSQVRTVKRRPKLPHRSIVTIAVLTSILVSGSAGLSASNRKGQTASVRTATSARDKRIADAVESIKGKLIEQ